MQHTVFIWYLVRWALFTGAILKKEVALKRHQTKRKKQRRFYLTNDKLKKVLIKYLNTRKEIEGDLDLNAPRITNQMSGKFSSASLQQCFKKMYKSVGIDASSHSGRRSFCTNLSENGISITNLQTLMGHQSISTTALYINENPKILGKITAGYSLWVWISYDKNTLFWWKVSKTFSPLRDICIGLSLPHLLSSN